jgi:carbamoyltransferase
MDIAASIQQVTEDIVLKLTRSIAIETGMKNLCLAGGVALNCVANGKILRDASFENIWIQPASGDAGGAVGAALAAYHHHAAEKRQISVDGTDGMRGAYLGPLYAQADIEQRLLKMGARFVVMDDASLLKTCVETLVEGKALGWFQGRMEFGPRALGARSILGDARSPKMQSLLNMKVKYRESFRPFAPSILREDLEEWFELDCDSPYMLLVADVVKDRCKTMSELQYALFGIEKLNIPRSDIPAVTHVDYSARIQTVHADTNPRYHALITEFKARTGCPVIVNTSFNVRGEPIVCTPEDAFRCFMGTEIEGMAIGNCFLRKELQNADFKSDYKDEFQRD